MNVNAGLLYGRDGAPSRPQGQGCHVPYRPRGRCRPGERPPPWRSRCGGGGFPPFARSPEPPCASCWCRARGSPLRSRRDAGRRPPESRQPAPSRSRAGAQVQGISRDPRANPFLSSCGNALAAWIYQPRLQFRNKLTDISVSRLYVIRPCSILTHKFKYRDQP